MKAEEKRRLDQRHEQEVEKTALAQKLEGLAERAKTGQLVGFRVAAFLIVVLIGGGMWWYLTRESRRAANIGWQRIEGETSADELKKLADEPALGLPAKVARLQLARLRLGPNGLNKLNNPETRKAAVTSIEEARTDFAALADEFKGDLTLRGQALDGWAHAELALVGIPRESEPTADRGDVEKAAGLFREFAELVGADTDVGKRATKQADELIARRAEVVQVAKDLNGKLTPAVNPTAPDLKLPPGLNLPAPPAVPAPKAPDAPVTPPPGEKKADPPPPPAPEKK